MKSDAIVLGILFSLLGIWLPIYHFLTSNAANPFKEWWEIRKRLIREKEKKINEETLRRFSAR